jgi:hypothetical protein
MGEQRLAFLSDPVVIAIRLERWLAFFFQEFLPQTADVLSWKSPVQLQALRAGDSVRCPECRRAFRGRTGTVGEPLAESPVTPGSG